MNTQDAINNIAKDLTAKGFDFLIGKSNLFGEQLTLIVINTDGTLDEAPLKGWQISKILDIIHSHKMDAESITTNIQALSFTLTTLEKSLDY